VGYKKIKDKRPKKEGERGRQETRNKKQEIRNMGHGK